MTHTRSSPLSPEEWNSMQGRIKQFYIDESHNTRETVDDIRENFGRQVTERQLKEQLKKWRFVKKTTTKQYHAMASVLNAQGNHVRFVLPTLRANGSTITKDVQSIKKEMNRKKNANPEDYEAMVALFRPQRKAMSYLRSHRVVILGLGDNPYADLPSDSEQSDVPDAGSEEGYFSDPEDRAELQAETQHSPTHVLDSGRTPVSGDLVQKIAPNESALSRWLAHQLAVLSLQQNVTYPARECEWKTMLGETYFIRPQNDPIDDMAKMFSRVAVSLDEQDSSRALFEDFLGCRLGNVRTQWNWDNSTDKVVVEFANYYVQQCLSAYPDLDAFEHPDRVASRQHLSQLFHARTGELLQVLWWVMTLLSTNWKAHQQEGLFQDIVDCISSSDDGYARALRPVFDVARIVNAQYIETRYTSEPYRRPQPNEAFEQEFRANIQYLQEIGMDRSGDFAMMHMFLAWYLALVGRPTESMDVILGAGCLPLAEKVLGTYHLAVLNCKALAANCYRQMRYGLAEEYINEALWGLRGCTKPLESFKYVLKRQQAMIFFERDRRDDGFKVLEEVIDFRLRTFGAEADVVWSVVDEMRQMTRNDKERQRARQVEQRVEAHYATAIASR